MSSLHVVVVIAQQLVSYHQLSRLRKSVSTDDIVCHKLLDLPLTLTHTILIVIFQVLCFS